MRTTHNDYERMFFNGKRSRVNIERESSQGNSPARELFPQPTDGEDENLGDNIAKREGGLSSVSHRHKTRQDAKKRHVSLHISTRRTD